MCGGQIFNVTAQMRCCNDKPCVGRGGWKYGHWSGEGDEEGRLIGWKKLVTKTVMSMGRTHAETLKVLCEDTWLVMPTTSQLHYASGKINTWMGISTAGTERTKRFSGVGDSKSLLLNVEQILIPCNDSLGSQGFKCSASRQTDLYEMVDGGKSNCLFVGNWCAHDWVAYKCSELAGKNAKGKSTDSQLCSNQTFWEGRKCSIHIRYNIQLISQKRKSKFARIVVVRDSERATLRFQACRCYPQMYDQ